MERVLADATLTQSTYYYSFYVLEALRKAGLGDRYIEQLAPWRAMLAMGLTTDRGESGTDPVRLTRVERTSQLRPPGHRARSAARGAGIRRCASRRTSVRCSGPKDACRTRWATSTCVSPGSQAVGCTPRSPCPRGSRACWSGAGRRRRCTLAGRRCRSDKAQIFALVNKEVAANKHVWETAGCLTRVKTAITDRSEHGRLDHPSAQGRFAVSRGDVSDRL